MDWNTNWNTNWNLKNGVKSISVVNPRKNIIQINKINHGNYLVFYLSLNLFCGSKRFLQTKLLALFKIMSYFSAKSSIVSLLAFLSWLTWFIISFINDATSCGYICWKLASTLLLYRKSLQGFNKSWQIRELNRKHCDLII